MRTSNKFHLNVYRKNIIKTPEQEEKFRKLYSEYRRLNPFSIQNLRNLRAQRKLWEEIRLHQEPGFTIAYCTKQIKAVRKRYYKLPILRQFNFIRHFLDKSKRQLLIKSARAYANLARNFNS